MSNQHTTSEPSEEQHKTRERIIAAASKVLAEKGYDATTLREISREAQAGPGLVHYYFGGKEERISIYGTIKDNTSVTGRGTASSSAHDVSRVC